MSHVPLARITSALAGTAVPAGAVAAGCGPASVAVADRTLYEGTPAAGERSPAYTTFEFTVSVTAAAGCAPIGSVAYKTEDGSPGATSPDDYVPAEGRLSWTGDSSPRTVAVQVVKDAAHTSVNVPYLDAIMYLLGISREEIEAADAEVGIVTPRPPI